MVIASKIVGFGLAQFGGCLARRSVTCVSVEIALAVIYNAYRFLLTVNTIDEVEAFLNTITWDAHINVFWPTEYIWVSDSASADPFPLEHVPPYP